MTGSDGDAEEESKSPLAPKQWPQDRYGIYTDRYRAYKDMLDGLDCFGPKAPVVAVLLRALLQMYVDDTPAPSRKVYAQGVLKLLQVPPETLADSCKDVRSELEQHEWFGNSGVDLKCINVDALVHVRCLLDEGPLQHATALEFIWRADPSDHNRQKGLAVGNRLKMAAEKRKHEGTYSYIMVGLHRVESSLFV